MSNTQGSSKKLKLEENGMEKDRMVELLKMCQGLKGVEAFSNDLQRQIEVFLKKNENKYVIKKSYSSTATLEMIYSLQRPPTSIQDKVFLVKWMFYNVSNCTLESIEGLANCETEILEFILYWKLLDTIEMNVSGNRQPLPVISQLFGDKWLNEKEFEKEKDAIEKLGGWKWKHIEQKWNEVLYKSDRQAKLLRVECFHSNVTTSSLNEIMFINKNIFSEDAASQDLDGYNLWRVGGCKCSCNKICKKCSAEIGLKGARLDGNKVVDFEGKERSFCAIVCGRQSRCSRFSRCRRFPQRRAVLLIAYQPRVEGFGIFALENIRKGDIICEYVGDVFTQNEIKQDKDRQNMSYQFGLVNKFVIDGRDKGNESRYMNHSCDPNCGSVIIFEDTVFPCPRLFFFAREDIEAGDELTLDYHPDHPLGKAKEEKEDVCKCLCGATCCRGYV